MTKRLGQNTKIISWDETRRNMLNVNNDEDAPALIYGSRYSDFVILEGIMNRVV